MFTANMQMMIGIGLYLVAMIIFGLWYAKRSNTSLEEYFIAKRSLGPWVASLSAEASDMSGWLLMGLPGLVYFIGVGEAFWVALGLFIGTWVNWTLVAKRLRSYSRIADNAITLPEFFSKRFHDKNRFLLTIAAIISLLFFSMYVGAQFVTLSKLFSYLFNINVAAMVILVAFITTFYTLLGGFRAVGITDVIQGLLMVFSLVLVLVFGFINAGGISGIEENLRNFPRFTDFFGIATPETVGGIQKVSGGVPVFGHGADYGFIAIVSTMAWGLGYFGMPQVLLRFMAIKKASMVRPSIAIAVTWCFIVLFSAVVIGLIGRAIMPTGLNTASNSENIFTLLTLKFFPPLLAGIVISGILAASMSSADSYLLITSSSLANDIYKNVLKNDASDKEVLWVSRITMLLVTLFGIFVALSGKQSIFQVVAYAWAGLGAAFGPIILFSLFWKRTTLSAAIAGMVSGGVMVVFWKNVIARLGGMFAVYELLPAFITSSLIIVIVSLLTKKPSKEIEKEFEEAKKSEF